MSESMSREEREELEELRRKEAERQKNIIGLYEDGDINIEVVKSEFWNNRQKRKNYTVGLRGLGNDTFFGAQKFMAIVENLGQIAAFFKECGQLPDEFDLEAIVQSDEDDQLD